MITCREVTDWLLEADLSELQASGERAIARHIAACRGCATRAARILGDTTSLAAAVSSAPPSAPGRVPGTRHSAPSRGRWTYATYVATALLAASLLFVLTTRRPGTRPRTSPAVREIKVASASTRRTTSASRQEREQSAAAMDEDPPSVARRPAPSMMERLSPAHAVAAVAVLPQSVPAMAVRAVRLDTLDASTSVQVEPRASLAVDVVPSTGRYAVLGSTPKVTVVWFY